MIPLSRRGLLAVTAVLDVAIHARPAPVSARALAARHGLSSRNLEAVLQALVRAGILKGVRGPHGGYELARERRRLSVGDVVRAVSAEPSGDPGHPFRSPLVEDVVGPALAAAGGRFLADLDRISIADLCAKAGTGAQANADFTI